MKRILAIAMAALALPMGPLQAGGDLPEEVVRAEILPGWRTRAGTRMAGLRLTLAPGWKTYWRAPGDAGIPPLFRWAGSQNVADVTVHWPRPEVFETNGMRSIGYADGVVLPLEIRPERADAPIRMAGEVDLGVCETVCIPATLRFTVDLEGRGRSDPDIHAALAERPVTAARAGVGAVTCRFAPIDDGLTVTARIEMPRIGRAEVVVVETDDARVWVSEAEVARRGGELTARADLVPPRGAGLGVQRSDLRFTVLGDRQAVDIQGCRAE